MLQGKIISIISCAFTMAALMTLSLSQDLPTINLCSGDHISTDLQFGRLVHTQDTSGPARNCTIEFRNVSFDGYTALTGYPRDTQTYGCNSDEFLNVSTGFDSSYCIGRDRTYRILRRNSISATLSTVNTARTFSVYFYNSAIITTCNHEIGNHNYGSSSLSGIISLPNLKDDSFRTIHGNCSVTLSSLPQQSAVRVEVIGHILEYDIYIGNNGHYLPRYRPTVTNADADGNLSVVFKCDDSDRGCHPIINRFLLRYHVIRCGDIPEFDKASHTEVSSPYLPNTLVHYKCVDGYQLKDDLHITCERSGSEALWINTITCIPVSRCVIPPENISNIHIVKTELLSNRTISYDCEEGYELPEGVQPIIITCSSHDEYNIPWTWNDTHINELLRCQRVMCDLADIINITNGVLTPGRLRYYYHDTIDFICDEGFIKLDDTPVICLSNRTWSIYPLCVEINVAAPLNNSSMREMNEIIIGSAVTVALLIVVIAILGFVIVMLKRRLNRNDDKGNNANGNRLELPKVSRKPGSGTNDAYEEVCNAASATSSNDQSSSPMREIKPQEASAYENTAFADYHVEHSKLKKQALYEEMSPKAIEDHTYTSLTVP